MRRPGSIVRAMRFFGTAGLLVWIASAVRADPPDPVEPPDATGPVGPEPAPEAKPLPEGARFRLGITRETGEGGVYAVRSTPDGRRIVTAAESGTVRLWDAASGELVGAFRGHGDSVRCADFAPDGKTLATASHDGTVRLWNPSTLALLRTIEGHADGAIWTEFDPDGRRLATCGRDGDVRLWDVESGALLHAMEGHTALVDAVCFTPDGALLVSTSHDETVRLWDAASGAAGPEFRSGIGDVHAIDVGPDGAFLAAGGDDGLELWEVATGRTLRRFEGHTGPLHGVAFDATGTRLVSGSVDGTVRIWNVDTGRELVRFEGNGGWLYTVSYGHDGRTVLAGYNDLSAIVWEVPEAARPPAIVLDPERLTPEVVWERLGEPRFEPMREARALGAPMVAWIADRLEAPHAGDNLWAYVGERVTRLDDPSWEVRSAAQREIEALGPEALPFLQAVDVEGLLPEGRIRLERAMAAVAFPPPVPASGDGLRRVRAARLLGEAGGEAAEAVLLRLAASARSDPAVRMARRFAPPSAGE